MGGSDSEDSPVSKSVSTSLCGASVGSSFQCAPVLMFFGGMLEERFEYSGDIATHRKKRSHADSSHQANFERSERPSNIAPFIVTLDMLP